MCPRVTGHESEEKEWLSIDVQYSADIVVRLYVCEYIPTHIVLGTIIFRPPLYNVQGTRIFLRTLYRAREGVSEQVGRRTLLARWGELGNNLLVQ